MPALAHPGVLTLATMDLDGRPMFWTDEDGTQRGYEAEVAAAAAARLDLATRWLPLPYAGMLPALLAGTCDAIWACQAITEDRVAIVDFSIPYGRFDEAVVVRCDDRAVVAADLAGRPVGAIAGSSNMALVESFPGAIGVPFDGSSQDVMTEMADALRRGEIDAFVDDDQVLGPYAEASDDLRIAFVNPTRIPYGVAFRKDSAVLRHAVDGALEELIATGALEAIWARWFQSRTPSFGG